MTVDMARIGRVAQGLLRTGGELVWPSRALVSGRRDGLPVMANWMIAAGAEVLEGADMLVPVPLHYRRLASRGYNQAGWLARAISRRADIAVRVDILKRVKATPSQGGLSARARRRNVAGAFALRKGKGESLRGKHVVLVDDVMTTGATLRSCSRILQQAGAASVNVLTLARVVRPQDVSI